MQFHKLYHTLFSKISCLCRGLFFLINTHWKRNWVKILNNVTTKSELIFNIYKKGHSCETSLLRIFNDLLWAFEHQRATALVAIDLSAAFDTVDHDVLLKVLQRKFGLKGTALKWADTYLRPRQFTVNVEKSYSLPRQLNYCVPQGSCAGPTYFNMYSSTIKM